MGGFSAQVQQGQTSGGGKMGPMGQAVNQLAEQDQQAKQAQNAMPTVQGANGVVTNSATSGQPMIGQANQYSNTVGQWDNAAQQPNQANQLAQLGGLFGKGQNQ